MRAWQRALREFIAPYRARRDVIGALVCGSYVTGAPSPRSDIDVVIVLAPGAKYRERGNRIVGGHLLEYFVGPPAQFRAYFANGHAISRPHTSTMFATGRVLFDHRGAIRRLRAQARTWLRRPPPPLKAAELAHERYFYWDSLDNLRDLDEQDSPGYTHAYHHHVYDVYSTYARFLRQPVVRPSKLYAYLSDARARKKYLQFEFPDRRFAALLRRALRAADRPVMRRAAEALTAHATERLGGFEIDGFRLRSRVKL